MLMFFFVVVVVVANTALRTPPLGSKSQPDCWCSSSGGINGFRDNSLKLIKLQTSSENRTNPSP